MTERCLLCGKSAFTPWFEHPPYTVVQCNHCGLVEVHPKPKPGSLYELYQEAYFKSPSAQHVGYQDYVGELENYLRTFRNRYHCLRRFLSRNDAVLEIGPACGAFLKVLQTEGFSNLHGVEISRFAVQQAASLLGNSVDLRNGYLQDQQFDRRFNAVVLWDVLEHLPNPLEELRRIHSLMNPDGCLILETQDVGSLLARLAGKRWHMYKFPEHIYHFNRKTITRLLTKAGFRVVVMTKRAAGKYLSGEFILERISRYWRPLRWMVAPWRRCLRHIYINPLDEMIVVARRQEVSQAAADR